MKRGTLAFPLLTLLIQFVSAQFFSGYGRFSLGDFFNSIDSETMILGLLFLIFFTLLFYILSRVFKGPYGQPNKPVAGTISLAISMLIIYGIYRSGFNLGDLFYDLGIGTETLYLIALIFSIILAIFLIKKIKFHGFLMVFGLLFILLTIFTELFYEKGTTSLIGAVLLLFGLLLWRRSRKAMRGIGRGAWGATKGIGKGIAATSRGAWKAGKWVGSKYDWEKEKKQAKAIGRGAWGATKGVGRGIGWTGKTAWKGAEKAGRGVGRGIGRGFLRAEEKRLQKQQQEIERQNAKQEKRQRAQQKIQQLNDEIMRLERMIPGASSVIERNKIEDQVRDYQKRVKKLSKFL